MKEMEKEQYESITGYNATQPEAVLNCCDTPFAGVPVSAVMSLMGRSVGYGFTVLPYNYLRDYRRGRNIPRLRARR